MPLKGARQLRLDWLEAALSTWPILTVKRTVPSERESGSESQVAGRRPTLKGQMLLLFKAESVLKEEG